MATGDKSHKNRGRGGWEEEARLEEEERQRKVRNGGGWGERVGWWPGLRVSERRRGMGSVSGSRMMPPTHPRPSPPALAWPTLSTAFLRR